MIGPAKFLLGLVVMAGGVGFWVWTPWWLWGTAFVLIGLGVMKFGGVVSVISFAGAVGLLAVADIPPCPLEMPVSSFAPCRCRAAIRFCGEPTPLNPGNMMVDPVGISATARSKLLKTLFNTLRTPYPKVFGITEAGCR